VQAAVPRLVAFFAGAFASASLAAAQPVPPRVAALAAKAQLGGPVVAWCSGAFRPRRPRGEAVAVNSKVVGRRYYVLDADGTSTELAPFERRPDLSCYKPAQARRLDLMIKRSKTLHGHITPRWRTTVVCGFIDDTTAVCWQYSPKERRFVQVGDWKT
jgi:hypothetical protein